MRNRTNVTEEANALEVSLYSVHTTYRAMLDMARLQLEVALDLRDQNAKMIEQNEFIAGCVRITAGH